VVIVANPRSGSGRGVAQAESVTIFLRAAGVTVDRLDVGPGLPPVDAGGVIRGADAVAVSGGDGTVLNVAPVSAAAGVPLYHLPAGNENLFSREFGMTREPAHLLRALQRRKTTWCDVGQCRWRGETTPSPFLLMASIGPDASVIRRLHASRKKASGHSAYIGPVTAELADPFLPRLRVWCDGNRIIDARGMLVVANCRHYAFQINPCPDARTNDGQLDVAFVPADTSIDALVSLIRFGFRSPGPDTIRARGAHVRVEVGGGAGTCLQVDGELANSPQGGGSLELSTRQGYLPVLDAR
jgi:diacylglycerol kinase (ATP)